MKALEKGECVCGGGEGGIQREMYIFGRKCEVSGGIDLWVEADIRQLLDLLSLPEGPNPRSPAPPTLYRMYPWLWQLASHQPRLPEGRTERREKRKKLK